MNTDKILSKIRSKRQELNYSQEYIASVLQMKQANYNKIENGKVELSVPVLFKIAKTLDLNVQELLNEYEMAKMV
ncbi:helix-turn-helix transcriptional regulator [Flavobacterium buctense]|uniref:Helix-turn-helix transcriptional regulator n=1 Tax=Flavobacterium buctense TaxID=1648146 RepID=A0ABU9DWV1_9FLAO|nr:helix-turn-helix transcriptional regulator [Flavobacterium buctense]